MYAADGYARATGRLGVALVTTGPGAANTLGGTGEAMASSSPVLVIATDIPTALRRDGVYRGVLHETRDQTAMFRPVTKAARMVADAEEIADAVLECGSAALAAPSGPVYLGIPTDLLSERVASRPCDAVGRAAPLRRLAPVPSAEIDRAACELLAGAARPLIWAGGGAAARWRGPSRRRAGARLAAPVITTYMGRGLLRAGAPVRGPRSGSRTRDRRPVGRGRRGARDRHRLRRHDDPELADARPPTLIAVNVDEADANKNYASDLTLVGDARAVLERLLPGDRGARPGSTELRARLAAIGAQVAEAVADR